MLIKPSKRIHAIEASGIRKVFDLGAKIKNPIDLSIGRPHFDVPQDIKTAAIESIQKGLNTYTPTAGIFPLRQKIAAKLKSKNGILAKPDEIIITGGASGAIFLGLSCLCDPGDEVIIPDPYFVGYLQLSRFLGIRPKFLDTYPNFQIDPKKIAKLVNKKTKAIIVNSPNNPTGTVLSQNEIEGIIKAAEKFGLIIISDEIYEDFVYDGVKTLSPAKIYPNTITISGFSKNAAVSGWRLGYLYAPKILVEQMLKLQQFSFVCAPSFAQFAIAGAFENVMAFPHQKEYEHKRNLIYNGLKEILEINKPQGSFYVFPKVPKGATGQSFCEELIRHKVITVPGNVFSQKDTHFRISFANTDENLNLGLRLINQAVRSL